MDVTKAAPEVSRMERWFKEGQDACSQLQGCRKEIETGLSPWIWMLSLLDQVRWGGFTALSHFWVPAINTPAIDNPLWLPAATNVTNRLLQSCLLYSLGVIDKFLSFSLHSQQTVDA